VECLETSASLGRSITLFQKRHRDAPQSEAVYSSGDPIVDKISKIRDRELNPERAAATNRERERLLQKSE
jgi:hypothetical protein